MGSPMSSFFERTNRLLDHPLNLVPRVLIVVAALLLVLSLHRAAVEPDDVRAAVPRGAAARHLQPHDGRRTERAGRQGDQRPQSLHRHARPRRRGLHRVQVDAVRPRGARRCSSCGRPFTGRSRRCVDVGMLFTYFGLFSLWSFGYKLYRYGHDLAPTAAVKVPGFTPPIFGYKQIANFEVYSYPQAGTYLMVAVVLLRGRCLRAGVARVPQNACRASHTCDPMLRSSSCAWHSRSRRSRWRRTVTRRHAPARGRRSPPHRPCRRASTGRPPASGSCVPAGTYRGDLVVDRAVHLVGEGGRVLIGSGTGSVVRVRADGVTIEGFTIDGRGGGDLAQRLLGHSRRRAARDDPRLPHREHALRHLPARGGRRDGRPTA